MQLNCWIRGCIIGRIRGSRRYLKRQHLLCSSILPFPEVCCWVIQPRMLFYWCTDRRSTGPFLCSNKWYTTTELPGEGKLRGLSPAQLPCSPLASLLAKMRLQPAPLFFFWDFLFPPPSDFHRVVRVVWKSKSTRVEMGNVRNCWIQEDFRFDLRVRTKI